jgi:IPT/TIG domain
VQYSITPNRGPVAGGTEVTIKGQFGNWPYGVYFGATGVTATRVDGTTLRATAPAHLPGPVGITIFEGDIRIIPNLVYTFEGRPQEAFDAVLLPVFTTPIPGAFGSEFRTDFRARLVNGDRAEIYGLRYPCIVTCIQTGDEAYLLTAAFPDADPENTEPTGNPGTFFYLPKTQAGRLSMNLRAYDTSRSAENFGTEIPIVRLSDFATGYDSITLIGVPSDPRFRNTLRIYGYGDMGTPVIVRIANAAGTVLSERTVTLQAQENIYRPGYVQISDFPAAAGVLTVTVDVPHSPLSAPIPPPDRWAFISVTNNETQHITLITPQP